MGIDPDKKGMIQKVKMFQNGKGTFRSDICEERKKQ